MESQFAGILSVNEHDPDLFVSEPIAIPYFGNTKVVIGIMLANEILVLKDADLVLAKFLKLDLHDQAKDSELVHHYYSETLKYGYTKPLDLLTKADIWKHVKPIEIVIDCDEVAVSCSCTWEEEHGLQLVFKNGQQLIRAGGHE